MDIDTLEGLRKCPLFEGLTDNEIIDLMHAIRYRVTRLYKGDFLFVAGEDCIHANILIDGDVVAYAGIPLCTRTQISCHGTGDDKHEGFANPLSRF